MSRILHICLGCFYIDNYSYQENLLPKYHKALGFDVKIVASTLSFDEKGNPCNVRPTKYINENSIPVVRLPYYRNATKGIAKFLRIYDGLFEEIEQFAPDIIFVHGCQFLSIRKVVSYLKKNNAKVYVDNHADFSNSARNFLSRYIQHRMIWRYCAHLILPFTERFYGVLPARVDFLINEYKLPKEKVALLVMGVDDELANDVTSSCSISATRHLYKIEKNDFLIVTGGKIDFAKREIVDFAAMFHNINSNRTLRLIIFGSVIPELEKQLLDVCDGIHVQFVGWLNNRQVSELLASSDMAVFPGRHSVLWEQTVGLGVPMVVKAWEGTKHIDCGGNVRFIDDMSNDMIGEVSQAIEITNYSHMLEVAQSCRNRFSYLQIAKRSIDI